MGEVDYAFLIAVYISFFLSTTIFSVLLNGLFLKFVHTLGIRNEHDTVIRWSSTSKPSLGGINFYIIFLLSIACHSIFFGSDGLLFNKQLVGILAATGLAFLMGLSDDAYNTRPLLKLGAQVVCGVILISTGTYISLFETQSLNYILTIIWVVGIMNSINMLDNMDAITTVVSIFIIVSALLTIYLHNDFSHVLVLGLIGVLASLIGFLFFNWNPSKMFMGDTGSQFLGIFLAAIGIIYFWNNEELGGGQVPTKQIIITVLAFIIPIIDTTTVTINRLRRKQAPWVGGRDHTTHHLSYMGLSDSQVAMLFMVLSFVSLMLIYFIIKFMDPWSYWYVAIFATYFIILFVFLYSTTRFRKARKRFHETERQLKKKNGDEQKPEAA